MASGTSNNLWDIWGRHLNRLWAVGDSGTILYWDGTIWSAMSSGTTADLRGIWGFGTDKYVVGGGGAVLFYNGSAWVNMSSGVSENLQGVWGNSSSDIFAVGLNGTIIHYNGSAWSNVSSGTPADLHGIWGNSSTDAFAVGFNGTITHYNGVVWSNMSSGTANELRGIWGINSSFIFTVGESGTILHYNGSAWNQMNSGTANDLAGVWSNTLTPSDAFAVGWNGTILRYNGSSWSEVNSSTSNNLTSVWGTWPIHDQATGWNGTIVRNACGQPAPGSCPYLYAWNGTAYEFIDVTIPDVFLKRYETTSYQTTTVLEPRDGHYDIVLHESLPEIGYMNSIGLWAVDHPDGTEVLVEQPMVISSERSGTIHIIQDPQPVIAVDRAGNDVTALLASSDGEYWESDLSGKDFGDVENLSDWIMITLPVKLEEGTAKLIVDARESMLGSFQIWYLSHFLLGTPNFDRLIDKLENDQEFSRYFDLTVWLSSAFTVQHWDGSAWVDYAEIPFVDHFFGRTKVVSINLSDIWGSQVRLHTPIGLREIDYVAVDYTADDEVAVTELQPVEATMHFSDGSTVDMLDEIAADDDSYAVLKQGGYINCKFPVLAPPSDGFTRTFIVPTGGYYYIVGPEVPEDKLYNWALGEELAYVPYAFSKWTLPRYIDRYAYPCSEYCLTPTSALDIPVFPPQD